MPEILIINNAEPGITKFADPIIKIVQQTGNKAVFIEYADCQMINLKAFDGVILTGSPQGDDIVEHHLSYFRWLKTYNKPVLGICAGHHVTGYVYGATLLRSQEPESGDFEVEIVRTDSLLYNLPQKFTVRQMHNDSITLPNEFELLVTSNTCKNQLMKHKNKPLYTCQFHPEFYNHQLIRNFIMLCVN
ncbi:homoserine O-succinyltransferase [uncultured Draconibacterium sp.]|uniref:type 1 glutamine amidotransferase n=1 Tax=uncultured Draconibacterium sp. TaxID=1573823 RepID=UPI0025F47352|nr:homoserine O-succinyltransferase [uncultured Draconibacterium sp.]